MADIAASVLAKLKNKARALGVSYQQCLQLFVQEEFLRKLSKSGYGDSLVLKGGLFIYTLTNFESRATIDVDFLLRGYSNDKDSFERVITLADNEDIKRRWRYFLRTIKDDTLEFSFVITEIKTFLEPVFNAIAGESVWQKKWFCRELKWL